MSQNELRQKILDLFKDSIKTNPNPRDRFTIGRGKNSGGQNLSGGLDFGLQKGITQAQVDIESWLSNRLDEFISDKGVRELRIDDLSRLFMNYMIAILGNLGEIVITGVGKNNEKKRLILKVVAVERISTDEKKSTTFPAKLVGSQGDKRLEIDDSKVLSTGEGGAGASSFLLTPARFGAIKAFLIFLEPQVGQTISPLEACVSKAALSLNQLSKPWPFGHMRSNTITYPSSLF